MPNFVAQQQAVVRSGCLALVTLLLAAMASLLPTVSQALPLFARQTGQNCLACHAGGQFPELTPFGRKFKLTGYTMGERAKIPLAVMAVASSARISSTSGSTNVSADFPKNGEFMFTTASLLCCGKITDNLGLFAQWTYDRYDHEKDDGSWGGKSHVDQVDLRYADRFISKDSDLIVGASLNNNPGVTDVWNTHNSAFTPVPTYVPVGNAPGNAGGPFVDVPVLPIDQALGQGSAGVTAYAFWNNTVYGEFGLYKAAERGLSIFNETHASDMDPFTRLKGYNPYWRLALNHDWGANSAMIGMHGFSAETYSDASDLSSPTATFRDIGIDGQYQYILDPHAVTAMFSYTRERQRYADELWNPDNANNLGLFANSSNTLDYWRGKLTYVYQAKYGAALAYTSINGSSDATLYATPAAVPNSRMWAPEVFWNPIQYVRVGIQYFMWDKYLGAKSNYDGNGRNASDNNTLFFYVWAAY
jgi:hypothetical protein